MDYQRIYNLLISHRTEKEVLIKSKELYIEKHHILPRCLGGLDEADNLVYLTAREHFVAHQLLVKIHNTSKLIHAANCMANTNGHRINGKKYQWIKEKWIKEAAHSHSEKAKRNISLAQNKRYAKIFEENGYYQTEEHRLKNSEANKGEKNSMYGKTHSEEARKKMSEKAVISYQNKPDIEKLNRKQRTRERFLGVPKSEEANRKNAKTHMGKRPEWHKQRIREGKIHMNELRRLLNMQIRIKRRKPEAVLPTYANNGDAGLDMTCINVFETDDYIEYETGISMQIPSGWAGFLFPRSSISKKDLILANSVGVIDSGYRGQINFRFKKTKEKSEKIYGVGDKIGQIIFMPVPRVNFEEVHELDDTERGEGGFGSTDNKI